MPLAFPSSTVNKAIDGAEVLYLVPLLDSSELADESIEIAFAKAYLLTAVDEKDEPSGNWHFRVQEPCLCTSVKSFQEVDNSGNVLSTKYSATLCVGDGTGESAFCVEVVTSREQYASGQAYPSDLMPPNLTRATVELLCLERRAPSSLSASEVAQLWGAEFPSFAAGLRARYPEAGAVLEPFYVFARMRITLKPGLPSRI